jgi:TonB-linked SusC/RagA family outer membrane protein
LLQIKSFKFMKKIVNHLCSFYSEHKKMFLVMRNSLFIILISAIQSLAVTGYAQNTRLTLDMKNSSVKEVLQRIEQQSEFYFLYNSELIDVQRKIDISVNNERIDEILNKVFSNGKVDILVRDRHIVLTAAGESASQQSRKISGKVIDSSGSALPGVTVAVKDTTNGCITDANGKYSLSNVPTNATLIFSFVGMKPQEVVVGSQTSINVTLEEETISIEEVVAVGYGTQKKMDLTGAISNMNSAALESRTVAKGSLALVGAMSGISVRQLSGNPRANEAAIRIRGLSTFSGAGNNPLILVDGIESSIDNVDPNDIKSISVLKDAAAASIYGSKAANGVILVETKRGIEGTPKVSYYSYFGEQKATMWPQMCDSWDYAAAYNEALTNVGQAKRFTDEDIQKFKLGTDPAYPNFDHIKYLFTSGNGIQTKQGISISGGTPITQYLFSAGYLNQEGIVMKNFTKRYDMRLNLNAKLKDNINLNINLSGNKYNGKEPSGAFAEKGIAYITRGAMRLPNIIPMHTADGYWGRNETLHPEADLNSPSFFENKNTYLYGTVDLAWTIIKDLKISGKVGYTYSIGQNKYFIATYPVTANYSITPNNLTVSWLNSTSLTLQSLIEYSKLFGDHSIHILGGFSQQQFDDSSISAYRDAFPNNEIFEIDAGTTTRGTQGGNASESRLRSFFGRGNYSYLDKYLFEANIRYDGSSKFPKGERFGLFPSFSAGWRVSKENFFHNSVPWINDLKIRGSWGELGNQSIGNYSYQYLISFGQNYPFGNSLSAGAANLSVPNRNITWESTRITDVGLDVSMMHSKLSLTADYFVKTTYDILYNVSASVLLGATPSPQNAGTVENKGWDIDLSHRNTLGDFSYSVSANLSIVNNRVVNLANVTKDIGQGLIVGYPIGSRYDYVSDGLFIDQADIDSYPTQPFTAKPGNVRLKDISGPDGVPDGIVNSTYDRKVVGCSMPISTYGLTLTGGYKGFDLTLLFQGEGGRKASVSTYYFEAFGGDSNIQEWEYAQRWTTDNPDRNAGYPRLEVEPSNPTGDFFIKNATFLRLKNVEIGYTLPLKFTNKLSLDKVRFYISGENLFTISKYYQGWDPEMLIQQTGWYPLTSLWLCGIKIDF